MSHFFKVMSSPLGNLKLVANEKHLVAVLWENQSGYEAAENVSAHPVLEQATKQLAEYFAGKRTQFKIPLEMQGTTFQKKVWQGLTRIPHGETRSYSQLASDIGSPRAFRAVGVANSQNPLSIVVPCHRVIGANGSLTGFAGGLDAKSFLLNLEKTAG